MKQLLSILLALLLFSGLAACSREEPVATVTAPTVTQPTLPTLPGETEPIVAETTTSPTVLPEVSNSFSDLQYLTFTFSSGAGGWQTRLVIAPDGSFTGEFRDTNMGITGADYPKGSVELCCFSGSFSRRESRNDYSDALTMDALTCEVAPGTVEIRDGVRYTYRTPYGLESAQTLLLYLPGTPVTELPEAFRNWVGLSATEQDTLPFYGLYDPVGETGFSGSPTADQLCQQVADAEIISEQLNTWIASAPSQEDMSGYATEKYALWDQILNDLWSGMTALLPADTMDALTREQQQWLQTRDAEVAQTIEQMDADAYYNFVFNAAAAKLTRNRVYELLEYLPMRCS